MKDGRPKQIARWAFIGVLFATSVMGCSDRFSASRQDAPEGVYPAGVSGEPTYRVGWRAPLYR